MKWYEIDYSWQLPHDDYRPTEQTAFSNLQIASEIIRKTQHSVTFSDDEWLIFMKDIELRGRWVNATVTGSMIAAELTGYSAQFVDRALHRISMVMILREYLSLPPMPIVPMVFRRQFKRIQLKRVA